MAVVKERVLEMQSLAHVALKPLSIGLLLLIHLARQLNAFVTSTSNMRLYSKPGDSGLSGATYRSLQTFDNRRSIVSIIKFQLLKAYLKSCRCPELMKVLVMAMNLSEVSYTTETTHAKCKGAG